MNLTVWCDRVIRWGFYLLFGLVPILLTPWNYELFEFNKMMAVYAITVIITGAWAIKSIAKGKLEIARTPLDIPLLLFLSSQLLSALFSIDPHVSWFGYYSRFNGGMLSIVSYVLLYYAFVTHGVSESAGQRVNGLKPVTIITDPLTLFSSLTRYLKIALSTGVVVAFYAVAERLGIDKHLWVQDVQNRVFSTLGQPNWLAAYLTALSPLAWGFALKSQIPSTKSQTIPKHQAQKTAQNRFNIWNLNIVWNLEFGVWCLFAVLFFLVLLFTRSRSGLFGFAVADMAFWGLLFFVNRVKQIKHTINPFLIVSLAASFTMLHFAFGIIIFFNGTYIDSVDKWITLEGWRARITNKLTIQQSNKATNNEATSSAGYTAPLLETGGTESGTIRKYVWQGAINAWRSSTKAYLIGTGTETFAFAFYQYRPKEHNLTSEWDFLYNKAHNEYLNYLATTGVLGLGSYLLLIGIFIVWFLKQFLISNFLIFKQIPNSKSQLDQLGQLELRNYLLPALLAGWLSILVTNFFGFSVVIVQVFLFLFPAMMIVLSDKRQATSDKKSFIEFSFQAFSKRPSPIIGFPIILILLVLLVLLVLVSLGWYADTLYASGYRMSRAGQYDTAVEKLSEAALFNPAEPLFADELGSAYAGLATVAIEEKDATRAGQFVRRSLASNDRAIATSPRNVNFWKTRTKIYYTFSSFDPAFNSAAIEALEQASRLSPRDPKITYNLSILYGRKGDNDKAIALLKTTIDLKPNYRDGYYALWVFYTEVRKPDLARQVLKDYLATVDPGDKEFLSKVNE